MFFFLEAIVKDGSAWTLFSQLPEGCRPTSHGAEASFSLSTNMSNRLCMFPVLFLGVVRMFISA